MNAPRDPAADFAAIFGGEADKSFLAEMAEQMREQYEREAIATAQSEAAQQAATKEYNRE